MLKMKPDRSCGPDGICPGAISLLPVHWYMTLATLFNNVFLYRIYPSSWSRAKMFTIFKKGDKSNTHNYRGISVINCITKLYDMVLCQRLSKWFAPYREQAGAQRKRGCLEHIVTLRLLTHTARRRQRTLFVTFADFTKAYDLVKKTKII